MKCLNDWTRKKEWYTPTISFAFELCLRKGFYAYIKLSIAGITLFGFDWGYDGRHSVGILGFWFTTRGGSK